MLVVADRLDQRAVTYISPLYFDQGLAGAVDERKRFSTVGLDDGPIGEEVFFLRSIGGQFDEILG